MPLTVLFDLDGTLIETPILYWKALMKAWKEKGIEDEEEVKKRMEKKLKELEMEFTLEKEVFGKKIEELIFPIDYHAYVTLSLRLQWMIEIYFDENVYEEIRKTYWQLVEREGIKEVEGARNFLEFLNENGVEWRIVTNAAKKNAMKAIENSFLKEMIREDNIIFADDVERKKPWPDPYLLALSQVKKRKEEVVVIEDSYTGSLSALRAEIRNVFSVNPCVDLEGVKKANYSQLAEIFEKSFLS